VDQMNSHGDINDDRNIVDKVSIILTD